VSFLDIDALPLVRPIHSFIHSYNIDIALVHTIIHTDSVINTVSPMTNSFINTSYLFIHTVSSMKSSNRMTYLRKYIHQKSCVPLGMLTLVHSFHQLFLKTSSVFHLCSWNIVISKFHFCFVFSYFHCRKTRKSTPFTSSCGKVSFNSFVISLNIQPFHLGQILYI